MRPHPTLRRLTLWSSLTAALLLISITISSIWWTLSCNLWLSSSDLTISIGAGRICFIHFRSPTSHPPSEPRWSLDKPSHPELLWWPSLPTRATRAAALAIPLWFFIVPTLSITALTLRLNTLARRHAAANACPTCRYDRAGLPHTSRCPECGAPPQ